MSDKTQKIAAWAIVAFAAYGLVSVILDVASLFN